MIFDIISISSDDDEVPIVPLKVNGTSLSADPVRAGGLKTRSLQQCEFCDEIFVNRYDSLIHNAKHIIIPLLKLDVHQCAECLFYFTSPQELKHHIKIKHKKHDLITNGIKNEKEIAMKTTDVVLDKHVTAESKVKIIKRLKFEDDSDTTVPDLRNNMKSKCLLNDLTTECKVNINLFDIPRVGEGSGMIDEVIIGDKSKDVEDDVDEECAASIHYDDLVKPGMYRCKRCMETFPTRFHLIRHDMVHMKIRKTRPLLCEFCERFISNNRLLLKQHIVKKHPLRNLIHRQSTFQTCVRCNLKYHNYTKHANNYHSLLYCHLCEQGFDTEDERATHVSEHLIETKCIQCDLVSTAIEIGEHQRLCHRVSNVSTIKLCETCCLFLKNKHNMQYVFVETVTEMGTRLGCERCGKKFFELKVVRRLHKRKERERLNEGEREKKKCLTNNDRLKNIQHRLKMINRLSKF